MSTIPKTLDEAVSSLIYEPSVELVIKDTWNLTLDAAANLCFDSDKSIHPTELGELLLKMKET